MSRRKGGRKDGRDVNFFFFVLLGFKKKKKKKEVGGFC